MRLVIRRGIHCWGWFCPVCGVLSIWHPTQPDALHHAERHLQHPEHTLHTQPPAGDDTTP